MQGRDRVELYPLKFSPLALDKVWGGHRLGELFPQRQPTVVAGQRIGEVWVVWDQLTVDNGSLRGEKLADLVRDEPLQLLGSRLATRQPHRFPLLVKLIDAGETLSVQVHPDDRYAREREGEPFGKAEAWYIIEADPQARLIHGVVTPLTRSEVEGAIQTGTLRHKLEYVGVAAGDVIMNPAGTIHALGEGLLLYELQQSSDLTYRLYDWDRNDPDRPLHIEKSLDVADLAPLACHKTNPVEIEEAGAVRSFLCACQHFAAEMLTIESQVRESPTGDCFHILTVLRGSGSVTYAAPEATDVRLCRGESVLVPASIHHYQIRAGEKPLVVIKAYVPDLLGDIVRPLRQKGIPEDMIGRLGGDLRRSDLAGLVNGGLDLYG